MGGWALILVIIVVAIVPFAVIMGLVLLVMRLTQGWVDQHQAKRREEQAGPSAADLYMYSGKEDKRKQ